MALHQVEKLYKKMITFNGYAGLGKLDPGVRSAIFQKIMDDVEMLLKKIKQCRPGSKEYGDIDVQIRKLLLKEIQVIIDDYIISEKNGTLESWKKMYGDINHYIRNFHMYREARPSQSRGEVVNHYGFYDHDDVQ